MEAAVLSRLLCMPVGIHTENAGNFLKIISYPIRQVDESPNSVITGVGE